MPRKRGRRKHIPQRTCVGCREVLAKRSLIRIVRSSQGVVIDPSGKQAGRGAYIHNQRSCWKLCLQGSLEKALKVHISDRDRDVLEEYMLSLPIDEFDHGD